jgi:hypothetical protein
MHTLLIWESVPENIDFYLIPDDAMQPEWIKKLTTAHGHYLNGARNSVDVDDALSWINGAIAPDEYADEEVDNVLHIFKTEMEQPLMNANISRVFYCGFIM